MWGSRSFKSRSSEGLAARRRRSRRRARAALVVLLVILIGLCVYGLRQPFLRVNQIEVAAGDPSLAQYATDAMKGAYLGLIPRDSTLFVPEHAIRARILADHADIAAVSIYHAGIRTIAIRADVRTAVGRWCGLSPTPGAAEYCYLFDPNGFVYEALPEPLATTTGSAPPQTLNPFKIYAPLVGDAQEPLRATIADADSLPAVFDFARQLASLGSPVTDIVIQNGEVDDTLASGSVVMYVLGQEQQAFAALTSAKSDLNLSDGSVDYVDARFPGKLYVKPVSGK